MGTTPEECAYYPWRIWVYPWRNSWKLKLHPQRILYFFALPLPSTSMFITYPWRIPWFLNQGRVDIKCKIQSPKLFYSENWHSSVLLRLKTGYFPRVTLHKVPHVLELYRSCWACCWASSKNKSCQFVARITTSFLVPLPLHRDWWEDPGNEVSLIYKGVLAPCLHVMSRRPFWWSRTKAFLSSGN